MEHAAAGEPKQRSPDQVAVLLDPGTGREKARVPVPRGRLIGHDGVGLWIERDPSATDRPGRPTFQRIRTAPDVPERWRARGRSLPEDLPSSIDADGFRRVDAPPEISLFQIYETPRKRPAAGQGYLLVRYFDARAETLHGPLRIGNPVAITQGGGYVWILNDHALARIPRAAVLRPQTDDPSADPDALPPTRELHAGDPPSARLPWDGRAKPPVMRETLLAWDGQQLWILAAEPQASGDLPDIPARAADNAAAAATAPGPRSVSIRLVALDVGLSRKGDSTERYQQALKFEQANGTLKAIGLFERIIADDPAAAEVQNHLAWALGTRPHEPYHDLPRAVRLVKQALQWQPWNPEMWDTLAEFQWRMGQNDMAARIEAKAINLNPRKIFYWQQHRKFRSSSEDLKDEPTGY